MTLMIKRTYKLPAETLAQFEQVIVPGKRSAMIDTLLREWLERQQRERLRQEVITGCREMAGEYLAIEQEFHAVDEVLHRAIAD